MQLGMEVGLGPGHTVFDGEPAPPQRVEWIKMPVGTEVSLGPSHIVLNERQIELDE